MNDVAKEEGISSATLFKWRNEARAAGKLAPSASSAGASSWTSADKFVAVVETASMNEAETSAYCRSRGIYPEELTAWRGACEKATDWVEVSQSELAKARREDHKKISDLQRELDRKEKALAEAAALLVLRKKAQAIWPDKGNGDG